MTTGAFPSPPRYNEAIRSWRANRRRVWPETEPPPDAPPARSAGPIPTPVGRWALPVPLDHADTCAGDRVDTTVWNVGLTFSRCIDCGAAGRRHDQPSVSTTP